MFRPGDKIKFKESSIRNKTIPKWFTESNLPREHQNLIIHGSTAFHKNEGTVIAVVPSNVPATSPDPLKEIVIVSYIPDQRYDGKIKIVQLGFDANDLELVESVEKEKMFTVAYKSTDGTNKKISNVRIFSSMSMDSHMALNEVISSIKDFDALNYFIEESL